MNTAALIHFPKPQDEIKEARKSMYSDKFENGYVMSSRLYRKEVWPFLSDAARNVYAELENRINGHNKESDFVSYSQLQGGELEGSRKMGRTTVSNALQELIKLGVITVIEDGKQGVKKYRLNDISLVDRFTNKTSLITRPVSQQDQDQSTSETETSPVTVLTIDNKNLLENKKKKLPVDKSEKDIFSSSVEYHRADKNLYSLIELSKIYKVQDDFTAQAQSENPDMAKDQILSELKNFAQWSVAQSKRSAQAWMNNWVYRLQKLNAPKAKTKSTAKAPAGNSKKLSNSQIDYFASKLCNHSEFASMYANVGETQKSFESRIAAKLRDPKNLSSLASYLRDVGFIGNLEDFA
ncbi:hypothetical protein [Acinetobacter sp. 243_ASPC]|uniref:hypothetical protein n=1 Tax=Acinetobacter sp. 243_ASPC TaxID=1579345 RepID=UPI00066081A8|nr:hypothetical protein [Acinetobacter sp. 243_ASPC]